MADLHRGIKLAGTGWDREFAIDDKKMSAIRLNDMARFICEVESSFYTSMRAFLRKLGFRQPIFGTGYSFCPFGLKSQGVFDTIGIGSGPSGSAVFVGPEHDNMGGINEYMSYLAAHRLAGHALVNREWYASYPDRYRTLGIVQTFVYGAFQGMDSISLHAPGDPRRVIQTGLPGGGATDPARAAVMAVMGLMHRRGDIREGKHTAEIALSPTDTFYVANTTQRGRRISAYRYLSYIHRVQNRFIGKDGYQGDADVVVTSGLSSDVNLKGAPRVFLSLDNPHQDLHNKRKGRHLPASILVPGLSFRDIKNTKLTFSGIALQDDVVPADLVPGIEVSSIPKGGVPFGITPDNEYCLGFTDGRRVIAPYCGRLERRFEGDVPLSYRLYLDAARKWGLIDYGPEVIEKGVITTDTGEISKWYKKRYMTYSAPRIQGGSGYIGGHRLSLDDVCIEAKTSFANIIVISLTMQPINMSDRILVMHEGRVTGEIRDVVGTPMDFRSPLPVGAKIDDDDEQLLFGGGYDHNWVLNRAGAALSFAARVSEPITGRVMEVLTTEPGVQFYTGNFLDGTLTGKHGSVYGRRCAFCLETQHFPDSPNKPEFPTTVLRPRQVYETTTLYRFRVTQ